MRIVCFGWVNTQKKLKESKSGKPTPPPQTKKWSWRIFWLESFQASCSGESMASGFSLTLGGRLFPKGTFPIANKPFAPPKLTGMNKNYTFPFRGSAWLYKGALSVSRFQGRDWYQLTCQNGIRWNGRNRCLWGLKIWGMNDNEGSLGSDMCWAWAIYSHHGSFKGLPPGPEGHDVCPPPKKNMALLRG